MKYLPLCLSILFAACSSSAVPASPAAAMDMNDDGFAPSTVRVKQNDTVCWTNSDDDARWPASNIHPTHEIYPEFDPQKPVQPGETWCFTFTKRGIWQLHDHLLPEFIGTVYVE